MVSANLNSSAVLIRPWWWKEGAKVVTAKVGILSFVVLVIEETTKVRLEAELITAIFVYYRVVYERGAR